MNDVTITGIPNDKTDKRGILSLVGVRRVKWLGLF